MKSILETINTLAVQRQAEDVSHLASTLHYEGYNQRTIINVRNRNRFVKIFKTKDVNSERASTKIYQFVFKLKRQKKMKINV